ncbi:MAG: protein kinase [Thermoanaerobaculia bacterium]
MIGTIISHFKITAKLGEGGMGEVYRAEDLDLQRPVAFKVLSAEILARDDMRARFLREARTAAALNHPNICTIYEVGEVDQTPFIAMELIEGSSLESRLHQAEQLPLAEIVRIAVGIAEGLAAAHGRGIVHRDLKPANVMLTADAQVKILDFGLAKPQGPAIGEDGAASIAQTITAEMTREGTILGTFAYMSPEQAEARPVDSRSDVFSFGILLYQMATGKLPFRGDSPTSTLAKILEAEPQPLSVVRQGISPDLERIVRRCLQKRPADRYNDTRDLVAELHDLETTGEAQAIRPAEAQHRARRWLWPAMATLAVVALVFLSRPLFRGGEQAPLPATSVAEKPSVAVLPFHNLSADTGNDYFSAGITEEIISKLSRLDGLEVASRSSVMPYKDPARDVRQIGTELGVRYLLDGSVRRAGDRVRVSAQLVDGSTGRNLWSEDFEGNLEDVFAMQETTALEIARQLDLQLSPEEESNVQRRSTENVLAYDAYLRAFALSREWSTLSTMQEARRQFERALELDPDFAAALAGLANLEANYYRNFDSSEEFLERAEKLAARAAELDPKMPQASFSLAQVAGVKYDYQRAAQLLRESVRLDPKEPTYWDNLSWVLAYQTPPDGDGAVEAAQEALRLQPDFPGAYYHLGRGLIHQARYEQARQAFERALELNPEFTAAHLGLAQYHLAIGNAEAAMASLLVSYEESVMNLFYLAAIHTSLGETDQALEALQGAFEHGFRDFVGLDASPYFEALRDDSRYRDLLRRYRD